MTHREAIIEAIARVAPEAVADRLDDDADFLDELGLDSMDILNLVSVVAERTGLEVAERDYPKIRTLAGFEALLARL